MRTPLYTILWLIILFASMRAVWTYVGLSYMVNMFPEGRRWWLFPVQLLTMAVFAVVVLYHPFKSEEKQHVCPQKEVQRA